MKTLRALLVILTISMMTSCASFQLATEPVNVTYGFGYYDYNAIHSLYITNPYYFYDNFYFDQYGVRRYYYNHPYFVRYCNTRNFTPNHHYYINNSHKKSYVNSRRTTTINRDIPVRRVNNSSTVRRSTPINNNYTTRNTNINTTRNSNISTPTRNTVNRSAAPRANIRTAPRANNPTNSVKRRN